LKHETISRIICGAINRVGPDALHKKKMNTHTHTAEHMAWL